MKKVILFLMPVLIAVLVFFGIIFFLDKQTGKGALQVTSVPKSQIYLDNLLIGTTPFCACDLTQMIRIGSHDIKLVPTEGNFKPFEEKIAINKSTLTAVDRTFTGDAGSEGSITSLIPLDDKNEAEVLVTSLPDKANVFLDSNPVGVTPLLLRQISPSDHDLRITKDGYKDKSLKIKTASGYKLNSIFFLGINADLSGPQTAPAGAPLIATPSASVRILDTPTGFLRVRKDNSIDSLEIGRVKPGEAYELIQEKTDWFEIKFASSSGWISSQYSAKE
jgi:hypothetical protein